MDDRHFESAVAYLKLLEGGYVNDPRDRGGETRYGISAKSHPGVDIKNLTWEGAKRIYKAEYWDVPKLGMLNDRRIVCRVFEQGANGGQKVGVRLLQLAYNALHPGTLPGLALVVDGIMGPKTAAAINSYKHLDALYAELNAQARDRYKTLADWPIYGVGWLKRLGIEP